ncbi:MAG: SDR family oxidoreductase [Bacteroidales bacterium]|nr:SDR family oxidoreductase [Bacteroidales bacterium]HOY37694.1 SDR family oxidoreductase [Bacteroidales bacterium]
MKQQKRVLITGCGGMLGESMYKVFCEKYQEVKATDIDLNESWLSYLDVREFSQCVKIFDEYKPEIVLHLAALTDLEYCETNHENSWCTNALGTENIAFLAEKYGCTMVYISTAGIFGGEQEYFTDFDTPNPLSHYAKGKYYGERFVLERVSKCFVFRPGWMMGGGPRKDKKFINKIYKQIVAGKTELHVVDDKLGTPTYTLDFANAISKVLETGYYGLYNQVCDGSCSRYDVAVELINILGLSDKIKITKVESDYFEKEYFAPRPYSEKLVNLKLNKRGINYMRDWKICLQEYALQYIEDFKKRQ